MNKKNILFICGNINPKSSQGVRYRNILPYLSRKFNLFILSYNRFYIGNNIQYLSIKSDVAINFSGERKNNSALKQNLILLYKKTIRPFIFPDKYVFSLPSYKNKIKSLFNEYDFSVVIIGMTPFSLYSLPRYIKSINKKVRVIIDLSDPFTFNGFIKHPFINKNFIKRYETKALRYIDDLIVLNYKIKNIYQQEFNISKIHVIEQGVSKISREMTIQDYRKKNCYQLIYAGGLMKGFREPFQLYKAIEMMRKELRLNIYGNIDKSLLPKNNKSIKYYGLIDHEILKKKYKESDILVLIDNSRGYQVPGKVLELLAMNKPLLFIYDNDDSPTLDFVKESNYVFRAKNNVKNILSAINKIIDTDFSSFNRPNLSKYLWKNLMIKYIGVIND